MKFKILLNIFAFTVAVFAQNKQIQVISPNGGEVLKQNLQYSISWNAVNLERVSIFYSISPNNDWIKIVENIDSQLGSYSWRSPSKSTNTLKIKIESSLDPNIYDISDNYSSISFSLNKNYSQQNLEGNNFKILPLGNSITFDNRRNDFRVVEDKIGYRYPLYNLLKQNGYNFEFIGSEHAGSNFFSPEVEYDANAGFPGIRDDQLFTLLSTGIRIQPFYGINDTITEGAYLNTYQPDIILLHIGTNGNDLSGGTSADDVKNILDEIDKFENTQSREVTVFLARIINRVPNKTYVNDFNDNVVSMALDRVTNPLNSAYPDKIVIVDMENIPGFSYSISPDPNGSPGDMNDEVHPNDKGYSKMAQVWFDSLKSFLGDPPIITNQPETLSLIEGDTARYSISVSGTLPLNFQWKKNNQEIEGATDSVLVVENVSPTENGTVYSCEVSNYAGMVESESADLFVTGINSRVTNGLQVLYNFNEGSGSVIFDQSGNGEPQNLKIYKSNKIIWTPKALEIKDSSLINSEIPPSRLYNSIIDNNEFTIEAWINTKYISDTSESKIITFSNNAGNNFSLLQNSDNYEVRVRTTETNDYGEPSLFSKTKAVSKELIHLTFTVSNSSVKMYFNGILDTMKNIEGTFANWDSTYLFGIGNELNLDQSWIGRYYLVGIYNRELSKNEIVHNYSKRVDGLTFDVEPPDSLISNITGDKNIELSWNDNSDNEDGFILRRKNGSDSKFLIISLLDENVKSFTDNTLLEGKKYSYVVSAFSSSGESFISNITNKTTSLPNPVDLNGTVNGDGYVELNWTDVSQNESGYIIQGKPDHPDSNYRFLSSVSTDIQNYLDTSPKYFTPFKYRVFAFTIDTTSNFSNEFSLNVVSSEEVNNVVPNDYLLSQNYPNPFNPKTTIEYELPQFSEVKLTIFNSIGEKVVSLVNEKQTAGYYKINFNGSNLNSGVYFCVLEGLGIHNKVSFRKVNKLILMK